MWLVELNYCAHHKLCRLVSTIFAIEGMKLHMAVGNGQLGKWQCNMKQV
jgi:hypothetical protein